MANMKKQAVKGANLWVWEGDLIHDYRNGGDIPMTFICMQLEGAPDDQVWFYKHFFLAEWIEDGYCASSRPEEIIKEVKEKGHVNLMDDWETSFADCTNGNVAERQKFKEIDDSDIPY